MEVKCIKNLEVKGKLFTITFLKNNTYKRSLTDGKYLIHLGCFTIAFNDYDEYFKIILKGE